MLFCTPLMDQGEDAPAIDRDGAARTTKREGTKEEQHHYVTDETPNGMNHLITRIVSPEVTHNGQLPAAPNAMHKPVQHFLDKASALEEREHNAEVCTATCPLLGHGNGHG